MSGDIEAGDARGDLEDALTLISGLASVLLGMQSIEQQYLGGQLREHYQQAHDAFSRVFKLDEYAERPEDRAPSPVRSRPGAPLGAIGAGVSAFCGYRNGDIPALRAYSLKAQTTRTTRMGYLEILILALVVLAVFSVVWLHFGR